MRDMTRIFLFLSFAVIVMLAPVFSGEYGGVEYLILSGRYGRTKCVAAKVIAGLLAAFVTTAAVVSLNVALAAYVFPVLLPVAETSSLFQVIALSPLYQILFVATMSLRQIGGDLLYAIGSLPVSLILAAAGGMIAQKIFAGHQVI